MEKEYKRFRIITTKVQTSENTSEVLAESKEAIIAEVEKNVSPVRSRYEDGNSDKVMSEKISYKIEEI